MRKTWWIILLAFIVAASTSRVSVSVAGNKKATRTAATAVQPPAKQSEVIVDGYGRTATVARERALANAQERVEELLVQRFGETGWRPGAEQLEPAYLERFGVIVSRGEPEPAEGIDGMVARYRVSLTPEYLHEVAQVARQERVHERHLVLTRILGGLLAVCLVVAGYLRLEEWTRGYATKLLRLVAVVVLLVVGLGLLLTL